MRVLLLIFLMVPLFGFSQIRTTLYDSTGTVLRTETSEGNTTEIVHTHEAVRGFKLEFLGSPRTEWTVPAWSSKLNYYGTWSISADSTVGCGCSFSRIQNDSLTYYFTGVKRIEYWGEQMTNQGILELYFDNVLDTIIDTYGPDNITPYLNWKKDNLDPDVVHSFKMVATGTRNPSSAAAYAVFQFLRLFTYPEVPPDLPPVIDPPPDADQWTIDNAHTNMNYSDNWTVKDDSDAGCSCSYASQQNDSVTYTFYGAKRIEWWGSNQPTDGIADVYMNNVYQATVDTYAQDKAQPILNWWMEGLDASDTITWKLVVKGERNPASSGSSVVHHYLKFFKGDSIPEPPIEPPVDPYNPDTLANSIIVSASGYENDPDNNWFNPPAHSMDDDFDTKWTSIGDGHWIQFELPETQTIESLDLATFLGTERVYTFDILFGNDGVNWDATILDQKTSGTTNGFENFSFPPRGARFIRLVGHENTQSDRNNWTEVRINITVTIPPDPPIDPPIPPADALIDIVRQGYYLVFMDGVQVGGGHSEYDKAVEKAVNQALQHPTSIIIIQAPTWRVIYE
jgi:hypothetical protein